MTHTKNDSHSQIFVFIQLIGLDNCSSQNTKTQPVYWDIFYGNSPFISTRQDLCKDNFKSFLMPSYLNQWYWYYSGSINEQSSQVDLYTAGKVKIHCASRKGYISQYGLWPYRRMDVRLNKNWRSLGICLQFYLLSGIKITILSPAAVSIYIFVFVVVFLCTLLQNLPRVRVRLWFRT